MGFTCGIVGLPNVGKSTIFNALTSAKAAAANFPFCTIEPNTGATPVRDRRLDLLASLAKSDKTIPAQMTFVDIAGLIRGASKGEGLGNQFLGHIRSCDAIMHVVRCFEDENVTHVEGKVDPVDDLETIMTELVISDYDSINKGKLKIEKAAKSGDKEARGCLDLLTKLEAILAQGLPASSFSFEIENESFKQIYSGLLTSKPAMIVANIDEANLLKAPDLAGATMLDRTASYAQSHKYPLVTISGKVESEIAELGPSERQEYLEALGLEASGLDRLALAGYQLLNLITFFTVGPKEARAWTAEAGLKAPQCAGKIHSDFERGFIRAEVISYKDYESAGTEAKCREQGTLRVEGKEYLMQDGDIVHFRFNV